MGRRELRRVVANGHVRWGEFNDGVIEFGDGTSVEADRAIHLPPVAPSKIICLHTGYDSRRLEFRRPDKPANPSYFFKPPSALNSHNGTIFRPMGCRYLNYEGELGVVIGTTVRNVTPVQAATAIAGYVAANDVGCHDFRDIDQGSMMRVKGMDSFCPVGPGIVSGVDIYGSVLRTFVNGKLVQEDAVADLNFRIEYLISDLSRFMTLFAGDLILTGTPANSRPMNVGDVVEVEVSQVGRLRNVVAETPAPPVLAGHQPTSTDNVRRVAFGGDFFDDPLHGGRGSAGPHN